MMVSGKQGVLLLVRLFSKIRMTHGDIRIRCKCLGEDHEECAEEGGNSSVDVSYYDSACHHQSAFSP